MRVRLRLHTCRRCEPASGERCSSHSEIIPASPARALLRTAGDLSDDRWISTATHICPQVAADVGGPLLGSAIVTAVAAGIWSGGCCPGTRRQRRRHAGASRRTVGLVSQTPIRDDRQYCRCLIAFIVGLTRGQYKAVPALINFRTSIRPAVEASSFLNPPPSLPDRTDSQRTGRRPR